MTPQAISQDRLPHGLSADHYLDTDRSKVVLLVALFLL